MAMRAYPDDREHNPVQLTLLQFINEGIQYYDAIKAGGIEETLTFLKFILAGRRGLDINNQNNITLNVGQGLPDIHQVTATRDFDSLIGTTKTLPYSVALTIWPTPSFRDTLTTNSHVTAIALDNEDRPLNVPMHQIPNMSFGKVANRSCIRVFFPRMYHLFDSNKIPVADIELIYNRCLLPIIRRLIPNQATHWPPSYQVALKTSRDRAGRLHLGSLDIPAHILPEFATSYLQTIETIRPYFRDAYFGHELRGWKGATVHNFASEDDQPADEASLVYERVNALDDLTRVLDMPAIQDNQWLVDVGLEFGRPGKVVTWRSTGHLALVQHLLPDVVNLERKFNRSKSYYVDNQMHLKDIAGFRWTPNQNIETISYVQAYTTEKCVSYQLHEGIFRPRKASELLSKKACAKLAEDLDEQSRILFACTGDDEEQPDIKPQEGCARVEVRVPLANANEILTEFPIELTNETMIQISASQWWYFKWLRLGGVFIVIENLLKTTIQDRISENSLALGAMVIWILNGAHRTPAHRTLGLARQACAEVLMDENDDPEDADAVTAPLMYEAGLYFICDIVPDNITRGFRIPWAKKFSLDKILLAYDQGSINQLRRLLGAGELQTGRLPINLERTSNRTAHPTLDLQNIRPPDRALPQIGNRLDGLPVPDARRPQGPDVDYFHQNGGGNRRLDIANIDNDAPEISLKQQVQEILEQMYYDILQESPNKRDRQEGAWTNIPRDLREELAVEGLYLNLNFPFIAVQYTIATDADWSKHFNRFFPPTIPPRAGQNFGKATYYQTYISLVGRLSLRRLDLVRAELRAKFNSLAWIPHTECDRMWCTRKTTAGRKWLYLPENGDKQGPKIAVNPTAIRRLRQRPAIRLPPRVEDLREEEEEEEEEEEADN